MEVIDKPEEAIASGEKTNHIKRELAAQKNDSSGLQQDIGCSLKHDRMNAQLRTNIAAKDYELRIWKGVTAMTAVFLLASLTYTKINENILKNDYFSSLENQKRDFQLQTTLSTISYETRINATEQNCNNDLKNMDRRHSEEKHDMAQNHDNTVTKIKIVYENKLDDQKRKCDSDIDKIEGKLIEAQKEMKQRDEYDRNRGMGSKALELLSDALNLVHSIAFNNRRLIGA